MSKFRLEELRELRDFAMQEIGRLEVACSYIEMYIEDAPVWGEYLDEEELEFKLSYEKGKLAHMQNNINQIMKIHDELEAEIEVILLVDSED